MARNHLKTSQGQTSSYYFEQELRKKGEILWLLV